MKKIALLLLSFFWLTSLAEAKIYIDVTQVSKKSFPIALVPLYQEGADRKALELGQTFVSVLQNDLELMDVFRFIDKGAFVEDPNKKSTKEGDIDFLSWAVVDALALVKGWCKVSGNRFTLEASLFDVLMKKELASNRYEGKLSDISAAAHKFANRVVEVLTGEPGLFESKIAFIGESGRGKSLKDVYVMNFNGEEEKKLTNHHSLVFSPQWSRDGKTIFYTGYVGKSYQLFAYDLNRDQYSKKSNFPGMVIGLRLSPVADLLATTLTKDGNSEIYLLNFKGEIARRVTNHPDIDVSPSFSPDGKQIAFNSNRDGSAQIYKMDIDGGNVQRLTFKGGNNTSPAWSPKGDRIIFAGMDTDGQFDIFSMNTEGSQMVRLTYDSRNNIDPCFAPDGQMIAFTSNRTGTNQIYIMRPDGSHQVQISNGNLSHVQPVWSPK